MENTKRWESDLENIWKSFSKINNEAFVQAIFEHTEKLNLATQKAIILFERVCAFDSTGNELMAEPLYKEAIKEGLQGIRRRRANIQLASTLRNNGKIDESIAILRNEKENYSDELNDAVNVFLALSLYSKNQYEEALSLTIKSLSKHLPRYQNSTFNYADEIEKKGLLVMKPIE